ncbi:MAG: GH92 family glycosyl hydrolase [Melioribacteraceae bacterium]
MKKIVSIIILLSIGINYSYGQISNPISPKGADPWVIQHDGFYYYCYSNDSTICINSSKKLEDAVQQSGKEVWMPEAGKPYSKEIWAPELHFVNDKWYIYFAADDGKNENHKMFVLESATDNPKGDYVLKGPLKSKTDKWAIDGTILEYCNKLYFIWSGWEDDTNVAQNLYIAEMENPYTITGERVRISLPEYKWEIYGEPWINEGPEILKNNGKIFIIYSASGSWTDHYCLGQLSLIGDDPLNRNNWKKKDDPVFTGTEKIFSPGHASFTYSPDLTENWIVYHTAKKKGSGWNRNVRIQKFTFDDNNEPKFGKPIDDGLLFDSPSENNFAHYVNPFIGTSNGGNTFPGAIVPWGMVSVSPQNAFAAPSGYLYGEENFSGFGHNHLSGTGCGDLGSIIIFPFTGKIDYNDYSATYKNENASPGFYSLYLDKTKVRVEATASERTGLIKFIPDHEMELKILIDVGRSLTLQGGGKILINSENEISGYNISGGFCGEENRNTTFFSSVFNKPFTSTKLIDSTKGIIFSFKIKKGEELILKTGISYTTVANAKNNRKEEVKDFDFTKIRNEAIAKWNNVLGKAKVIGEKDDMIKFYTAIYHTLIHPNIINDVNGDYPLYNSKEIGKTKGNRYTIFSLWDTYRTLHPFYTLLYPDIQLELINTMLAMYKEGGFLPKWDLLSKETYMMVGDPVSIVIADSYIKGIKDFDTKLALEAMIKPAILKKGEHAPPIRAGYHQFLEYGYIPFEQSMDDDWWVWGPVSTNLEYNLADWSIAQFAKRIGNEKIEKDFFDRSMEYKNIIDTTTKFARPRLKNGEWLEPFDPFLTVGSTDWEGSGGPGYVEGNAWNYSWFVPFDIPGLIKLYGGEKAFVEKLLECFNNNQFTINNEPDFAYPYLFNYVKGYEHNTPKLVTEIMESDFGVDHAGLPGNDDCGATSAWFAFSALGFYPDLTASENYSIGVPLFDKITLSIDGKNVTIEKSKTTNEIIVNGKSYKKFINHFDIVKGDEDEKN